jgi:CRP-like cAMP-binding protein
MYYMGQIVDVLKKQTLFKELSEEDLESLEKLFTEREYQAGEVVFNKAYFTRSLGILVKGRLRVYKQSDGKHMTFSILRPYDSFGMAAMFTDVDSFQTDIVAIDDCSIIFISEQDLKKAFISYPKIAIRYIELLSSKIIFLNHKIEEFSSREKSDALYKYLLEFNQKEITIPIPLKDLARSLNMSRSSLYRSFDILEGEGLIKRKNKKITMED